MKKIVLTLCVAASLFASTDAMPPIQYTVNTNPPVSVVVTQDRVRMGFMSCRSLNLSQSYNGIPMFAPLVISAGMEQNEIVNALKASFGNDRTVSILVLR